MTLAELQDNPDYINANEATKRAIFEQYSQDDKNFTSANTATQAAIREQFGVAAPAAQPQTAEPSEAGVTAQMLAPAVTAAGFNAPTGLGQLGSDVAQAAQPLVQAGRQALQGYTASPGKAIVDVGAAHLGIPPPYATAEGLKGVYNTYKGAKETIGNLADMFSRLPPGTDKVAGAFVNGLNPADQAKFINLANSQGLEKAFRTYQAPGYLAPEAVQSLNATRSAFPSTMQKVGQAVTGVGGPILRGAARVAGPVGMGMNLYDAGQMARQTELGSRLAAGQGQRAEQAFRAGPVQSYQGPQLSAQEAQNVLQNGSARDKQYFNDQLNMAVRLKAAKKVLGQ